MTKSPTLEGTVLDDSVVYTLHELCQLCSIDIQMISEMVEEGVVEPHNLETGEWRFTGIAVTRVQVALRLQRDLGVNLPGAALALELLEELRALRRISRTGH